MAPETDINGFVVIVFVDTGEWSEDDVDGKTVIRAGGGGGGREVGRGAGRTESKDEQLNGERGRTGTEGGVVEDMILVNMVMSATLVANKIHPPLDSHRRPVMANALCAMTTKRKTRQNVP